MGTNDRAPAVVVGVDGSPAALHAARWAIDEAAGRDIPLRLVSVIDPDAPRGAADRDGRLAAARAALREAGEAVDGAGQSIKVESEILWGRPLAELARESRSAAMICVGSIGLDHACSGEGSTAAALAGVALCPVAVIQRPAHRAAAPNVGGVVARVDNGAVLRCAFEEARLRRAPLLLISISRIDDGDDGSRLAQAQLERRVARWTRLYPDVEVESLVARGSVARYFAEDNRPDRLFVTDFFGHADMSGAACSVLAVRRGNL